MRLWGSHVVRADSFSTVSSLLAKLRAAMQDDSSSVQMRHLKGG